MPAVSTVGFLTNSITNETMMQEKDRDFKGVWIPKEIYLSKACCWAAKMIFVEIHSFTNNGRECFVSNEHLSELFGISTTQVSKHISTLLKIGWVEQTRFDGRKRYLRASLELNFKAALPKEAESPKIARQLLTKVQGSIEAEFNHTIPNTVTTTTNDDAVLPHNEISFKKLTMQQFREQVHFFKATYTETLLKEFYNHWKQRDANNVMKFQLQSVWCTETRLEGWKKMQDEIDARPKNQTANGFNGQPQKHSGANDLLARTVSIVTSRREENTGT